MLVPMQLQFKIELNNDDELIHRVNNVAAGRVVINRFLLWIPKLTPKDSIYDRFVSSFLKETLWTYMREMYEVSAPTTASGSFQISATPTGSACDIVLYYMRAPVFPRVCDYRIHLVVQAISLILKLLEFLRCDAPVS